MVSFVIREETPPVASGVPPAVERFVRSLRLVRLVPSLGEVAITLSHPASTSHRALPPQERQRLGIVDTLVRLSVGAEDVEDIWADLDRGLGGAA